MSLEKQLKEEILALFIKYENAPSAISIEEAQAITAIRQSFSEIVSLIALRHEIMEIITKMPGSFFEFLPFVITLKKELQGVFDSPQYDLANVLTYEAVVLRDENKVLKLKLAHLESKLHNEHVQQSITDNHPTQKSGASEKKELTQSIQLLRMENKKLLQQACQVQHANIQQQETITTLQSKAVSAEARIESLQQVLLTKENEIELLRKENALLKQAQVVATKKGNGPGFW